MQTLTVSEKMAAAQDFLPINGTDYLELYVGNAKQSAHYYKTAFGYQSVAYAGPETGVRDRASYVLQQGKIRLVLTTALNSTSPIAEHVRKHGDGVKILALWVDDARSAFEETTKRGAKPYQEPTVLTDEQGEVVTAGIYTYGETIHMFVERKNYKGIFMPGYKPFLWQSQEEIIRFNNSYHINISMDNSLTDSDQMIVAGDDSLLKVAVSNLIDNACKYSLDHTVDIEFRHVEKFIEVVFTDRGIGIPDKDLEKIFEPFYRGANTKSISGSGIGLPLVNQIIKNHNGSLRISSQVGKGTNVTIQLPTIS